LLLFFKKEAFLFSDADEVYSGNKLIRVTGAEIEMVPSGATGMSVRVPLVSTQARIGGVVCFVGVDDLDDEADFIALGGGDGGEACVEFGEFGEGDGCGVGGAGGGGECGDEKGEGREQM
jgi:hypothetical protein